MRFINAFREAISPSNYVSRYRNANFNSMLWFLFRLCFLKGLLVILIILPALFLATKSFLTGDLVHKNYPAGLEINIVNGLVTTNEPEPYFVPNTDTDTSTTSPKNLLAIDTKSTDPVNDLAKYHTFILLTKDSLITAQSNNSEIRIIPLKNVKDFHITQESAQHYFNEARPYIVGFGILCLLIVPIIIGLFSTITYLVLLLIYSLVTLVIAKFRKIPLTYAESYTISGYLLALPIVIDLAISRLHGISDTLITFIAFVIFALLYVKKDSGAELVSTGESITT